MCISVASLSAENNWVNTNLKEGSPWVDHWHLMNYDCTVSDVSGGTTMSPDQPLYLPSAPCTLQMSVDYAVREGLQAGAPTSKIMVGDALSGHTWYASSPFVLEALDHFKVD